MENKELSFDDYVEMIFMLKALTIELSKKYLDKGENADLKMLKMNLHLLSKFEENLDVERLDTGHTILMQMYTATEIKYLTLVNAKEQECAEI